MGLGNVGRCHCCNPYPGSLLRYLSQILVRRFSWEDPCEYGLQSSQRGDLWRHQPHIYMCVVQDAYDLRILPAIIIVDPNTGQKMHERTGNVTVERFLEEISPFLDMEPSDPNAGTATALLDKVPRCQSQ